MKSKLRPKQIKHAILLVCLAVFAVTALRYINNAGTLKTVRLDTSELMTENQARTKIAAKKATIATAIVTEINDYALRGVKVRFDGVPENILTGTVWLKEKDVAKINVGDTITVRGRMKYVSISNQIYIGDSWPIPPLTFKAKLLEINNQKGASK